MTAAAEVVVLDAETTFLPTVDFLLVLPVVALPDYHKEALLVALPAALLADLLVDLPADLLADLLMALTDSTLVETEAMEMTSGK